MPPVDRNERIQIVDALRGFALLGILLVNMDFHAGPLGEQIPGGGLDRIVSLSTTFFAEGKFYPLFSFLFGFGLAVQLGRADDRRAFAWRWTRRQLALLLFGLAHALFLWPGDILTTYALVGVAVLPFVLVPPRFLPWIGLAAWLLGTIGWTALIALIALVIQMDPEMAAMVDAETAAALANAEARRVVYSSGTFVEMTAQRAIDFGEMVFVTIASAHVIFAMFLGGLWAGATGVFRDLAAHAKLVRRTIIVGLALGLPLAAVLAATAPKLSIDSLDAWMVIYFFAAFIGGPLLAMGWAATFVRFAGPRLKSLLAPAGRMALTNYLGQSLICAAIFQAWGFGLYGSLGDSVELALVLTIFFAQVGLSHLWLARFRFGPMEWLWRAITYRTIP